MESLDRVVATAPYSDWNVSPLMPSVAGSVQIKIEKLGSDIHVYYSYPSSTNTKPDKDDRFLLREKKGFTLAPPTLVNQEQEQEQEQEWWIGAMVCGPLSNQTHGTVEQWHFQLIPPTLHSCQP